MFTHMIMEQADREMGGHQHMKINRIMANLCERIKITRKIYFRLVQLHGV